MWVVLKIKKYNDLKIIKNSLLNLFGSTPEICNPKVKIIKNLKNKIYNKDSYLLDKYVLVYHEKLSEKFFSNKINYIEGIDYALQGFKSCQKNISDFVKNCKSNQDCQGYIKPDFFNLAEGMNIKFSKGPFVNLVSRIVEMNKKKLKILVGDFSIYLEKKDSYLSPAS